MTALTAADRRAFYRGCIRGLRALDARPPVGRWFGPDAGARWRLFRGELGAAERLDLIVRDAAMSHAAAFSPRVVFGLSGLTRDEPFGVEWPGPDAQDAHVWMREAAPDPSPVGEVLGHVAAAWMLEPDRAVGLRREGVGPTTRVAVAGAGAIVAVAEAFAGREGFDLADQARFVAASPAERQLAGLAVALLGCAGEPVLVDPAGEEVMGPVDLVVLGRDASSEAAAVAKGLAG